MDPELRHLVVTAAACHLLLQCHQFFPASEQPVDNPPFIIPGTFDMKLSLVQLLELLAQCDVTLPAGVWEQKSRRGTRTCSLETSASSLWKASFAYLLLVRCSVADPKPHHLQCFPSDLDSESLSRRDFSFTLELCAIKEFVSVECSSPSYSSVLILPTYPVPMHDTAQVVRAVPGLSF